MISTISLQVAKSLEEIISPKFQRLLELKLFNKYKSIVKHFGKRLTNFLKKKELSNKFKQVNKKLKTEKFIMNSYNGRLLDAIKWISIPMFTLNLNLNFIQFKLIGILHKIFIIWD